MSTQNFTEKASPDDGTFSRSIRQVQGPGPDCQGKNEDRGLTPPRNLLDEEVASRQELDQLSTDEKLTKLERSLEETFERLTTLTERFNGVQQQFKQRITRAERELRGEHELQSLQPLQPPAAQRLSVPQQH